MNYYFADHLGSSRVVTNATGTILDDSDFYPFGGERVVSSSSGNSYKFTGKERDAESNLDYFGARYLSSSLGRFLAIDPKLTGVPYPQHLAFPQSLNMYTYTQNNPLKHVDPDGEDIELTIEFVGEFTEAEKSAIIAEVKGYLEELKMGNVVVRQDVDKDTRTIGQMIIDALDFGKKDDSGRHTITVDLTLLSYKDAEDLIFAKDMAIKPATESEKSTRFGDLRSSDPKQWAQIIAHRILHETLKHAMGFGSDNDQLEAAAGKKQSGTLFGGYDRGRKGIPPIPEDVKQKVVERLKSVERKYEKD